LTANTTASTNTAVGYASMYDNTTGANNVSLGYEALGDNTTATGNAAAGYKALRFNTTGASLSAFGAYALYNNTTGSNNTASGYGALLSNTTGYYNTAVGTGALQNTTTSYENTAVGFQAGYLNILGRHNVAIGHRSLYQNTSGHLNTAIGLQALYNTTGQNNIGVGYDARSTSAGASNQCTLGNSNISNLRCNDTSISSLSDSRDKTDVIDSPYGLDFINAVRPVQYLWDTRDGNVKDGSTRVGFIAQELLAACDGKNAVLDLVLDDNPEKLEAKYGNLLPIMVQAIKDLSTQNAALAARLTALEE